MKLDVGRTAHLSRLSLTEDEKEKFSGQLASIFDYVSKLSELDTSGIEPTFHVLEITNVMREDEQRPSLPKEDALRNAPDRTTDFYRVPKIIE